MENLSTRTSWQDLKDYMRQAGDIMYTNTSNGEGIVEFGSRSDMDWALDKLDGAELDGRKIKLIEKNGMYILKMFVNIPVSKMSGETMKVSEKEEEKARGRPRPRWPPPAWRAAESRRGRSGRRRACRCHRG